jgi:hypothetical protein
MLREADRVERLVYTRRQAAEALGLSLSTLDRRIVPAINTVRTPWGTRLIPIVELERYLTQQTQRPRPPARAPRPGRRSGLSSTTLERIRSEHAAGRSLGEIAHGLNADGVPTSQGGRRWWPSSVRSVLANNSDS